MTEILGLHQFGPDGLATVCCVGRDKCPAAIIIEFDEACILDSVFLRFRDREDHPLRQRRVWPENHLDLFSVQGRRAAADARCLSLTRYRVDADRTVFGDGSGPERQGRNVAFADATQTKNDTATIFGCAALIGVRDDARVEQRR